MSQQEQVLKNAKPWVLLSSYKENINLSDVEQIVPQIQSIVDEWHTAGKIMWSGALDNNKSGMAIFEADEQEAKELFNKYNTTCNRVLDCFLYQWDAMPILSLLSQK